jgi:hypothetical protein
VTYANVTATLALFLALGGGAYAAATLPARSVGSKQLKKNAVVRAKIKKNAVNGSKVSRNALTGADILESSLTAVPSATTADNATHATSSGALDKATYKAAGGTAPANAAAAGSATATCDAGQHVTGGGVKVDNPDVAFVNDAYPDNGNTAWTGRVFTESGAPPVNFTVYAICTTFTAVG